MRSLTSLGAALMLVVSGCSPDSPRESPRATRSEAETGSSATSAVPTTATSAQTPSLPSPASTTSTPATSPAPAATESTRPLEAPGAYLEAVVSAKFEAQRKLWLADLRQRIAAFEVTQDRKPANLEEIAGQAPLPTLPPGLEFQYDPASGQIDIVPRK